MKSLVCNNKTNETKGTKNEIQPFSTRPPICMNKYIISDSSHILSLYISLKSSLLPSVNF